MTINSASVVASRTFWSLAKQPCGVQTLASSAARPGQGLHLIALMRQAGTKRQRDGDERDDSKKQRLDAVERSPRREAQREVERKSPRREEQREMERRSPRREVRASSAELEQLRIAHAESHKRMERFFKEMEERELKRIEDERRQQHEKYMKEKMEADRRLQEQMRDDKHRVLDMDRNPQNYSLEERMSVARAKSKALEKYEMRWIDKSEKKFNRECNALARKHNLVL